MYKFSVTFISRNYFYFKAPDFQIHAQCLKFGLYEDYGTHTCEKYPGSEFHLKQDLQTFADWGVDYLKLDACFADSKKYHNSKSFLILHLQ